MAQLQSAVEHYQRQQQFAAEALEAARRNQDDPTALAVIIAYLQLRAAREALAAVEEMLEEQSLVAPLVGTILAGSFAGTASSGLPLDSLFSLADNPLVLALMAITQVQDAGRQAASVSIAGRPRVGGYVRMLNQPSCSRCIVLAGKFYPYSAGFERHPKCDCRHIPVNEDAAGDLSTDPDAAFRSLSRAEQDRIFGKAGAEALRLGADMSQVVNARSGMSKAQSGLLTTTAGTTRRGTFGRSNAAGRARLMPESILERATSRDDAIRLLRLYRYIT